MKLGQVSFGLRTVPSKGALWWLGMLVVGYTGVCGSYGRGNGELYVVIDRSYFIVICIKYDL